MLCKLTNQDMTTHNGTKWEIGVYADAACKGDAATRDIDKSMPCQF